MKLQSPMVAIGVLVSLALLIGCDSSPKSEVTDDNGDMALQSTLVGDIKINGSSTVQPISDAIRESFIKLHPGVSITVRGDGTGTGFKDFYAKSTDISDASRPIKPGEMEKAEAAGVQFLELAIASDGLTIAVNPENDWVKEFSIEQLKKIFIGPSAAKKWSDVDPSWPKQDIKIFSPGTGSGSYDYFKEIIAGEDAAMRGDMNLNEDDNVLVQGVAGNKYSIGFFGVAYYVQNAEILKAVPIINPDENKAYLPSTENIASGKYAPFSRPLFIYVSVPSLNRAEMQTFVAYYLENVSTLCAEGKVDYVQLPENIFARTMEIYDAGKTGTHFVTNGESRKGSFADLYVDENLTAE